MYKLVCFTLVVFATETALAISEAQKGMIQAKLLEAGIKCIKDNPLSSEDIKAFKSKMLPDRENAKCFVACLFKSIGIMDDMGKISPSAAKKHAQEVFDDQENLKNLNDFIEKCSSVNDEMVSDGNKGCNRASLAFNCMSENAAKFGFDVDF